MSPCGCGSVDEPVHLIDLDAPTPDVRLELASLYATAHQRGPYSRKVRRDRPLALPLGAEDIGWAKSLIAGG
jgi:hypothetical protein